MLAEIFQRTDVEEGCYGHEAVAFVEIAPEQKLLVDYFHITQSQSILIDNAAQFVVLLAVSIDFGQQVFIVQIIPVFLNQVSILIGTAQGMAHFQQEDNG